MSFKKRFFSSISNLAVYNYISQGLEFFSTIILSRLLLPEEYGFVAMIMVFSGFIQRFSNVGISVAIVRSDYGQTFHRHLYSFSLYIGIILSIVMVLISYPISVFFENKDLIFPTIVFSARFIFDSFVYIPYSLLTKRLQFKNVGIALLAGTIFQISFTIILALLGFSYWSIMIPLIFGPLVQYLFLYKKIEFGFRLYSIRAAYSVFKKIMTLMGNLSLNNTISYWTGNADKVIVGKFYTQADLGLYNRAFRFIMVSTKLVTSIFSAVLLPSLKKLIAENGDVSKEYFDIIKIITLFNMPIVIILIIFPTQLVTILWGNDWIEVAKYLPYIGIILMYHSIPNTMKSVFLLYVKERNLVFINILLTLFTTFFVFLGAMYSMIHIMIFMTLGNIVINIPIIAFLGFVKTLKFKVRKIVEFLLLFVFSKLMVFAGVYTDNNLLKIITLFAFNIILLYQLRTTIKSTLVYLVKINPLGSKESK